MTVLHSAPRIVAAEGLLGTLVGALGDMVVGSKEEYGEIVITVGRDRIE